MATPIDVVVYLCSNVVKIFDWKSIKSCVIYRTEKKHAISAPSQTVCTERIAPKIKCWGQHLAHNVANFIQIGSFSAEL